MRKRSKESLISRGFPTDLTEKIGKNNHTVQNLKSFSETQLSPFYSSEEISIIRDKIKRKSIPSETVKELLCLSNTVCCYCKDGNSSRPYQIHHIVEHSVSQDDSLENLMLVCPTHHSAIPAQEYSVEQQKEIRKNWYGIVGVENGYKQRGIPFPFHSFESINTECGPKVSEIIKLQQLSPSTACIVSEHPLGKAAKEKLSSGNFLLITGGSGSGKSTFAVGVAVMSGTSRIYRYITPSRPNNGEILNEILTFVGNVSKSSILILDDINLWATKDDIQKLSKSTTSLIKIIATATSDGASDDERDFDYAFIFNRMHIDWEITKPYVTEFLKNNEPEVVELLKSLRNHSVFDQIGFDPTSASLDYLIWSYGERAKSVWQFIFLLTAGWTAIENELNQLISNDRADIPVAFVAIEQLAAPERAVSKEEIATISSAVEAGEELPADLDWTAEVLNRLVKRRVLNKVRNHYTTIHREWARAFICEALKNPKSRDTTIRLLKQDFDVRTSRPERLARLLAWFDRGKSSCREFAQQWVDNQNPNDWAQLMKHALEKDLETAALVARDLSRLSLFGGKRERLEKAVEPLQEEIVNLVKNASHGDWENLRNLLAILSDLSCSQVIKEWSPKIAANVLSNTNPEFYDSIKWLLGGNICKHSRDWCAAVGREINWDSVSRNLSKVPKGDVETVDDCISILFRLELPIKRSMVARLADATRDTLTDASLSDMRFGNGIKILFEGFPDELNKIISSLDAQKIGREISTIPPHKWKDLMQIFWMANRAGSNFSKDVFEYLDVSELAQTVKKYAQAHPRTFLPLLYLLKYAVPRRRDEIARKLYESALIACKQETEGESVLEAFMELNRSIGNKLAKDLGINPKSIKLDKKDDDNILNQPLFGNSADGKEALELIAKYEQSGNDYDVGLILWGPYRESH